MQPLDISIFRQALQNPSRALDHPDLKGLSVECDDNGLPRPRSGAFAMVFRLRRAQERDPGVALRCFKSPLPDLAERYQKISARLDHQSSQPIRFFVRTKYVEKGVFAGGAWRPITTLDWVHGRSLTGFVESAAHDRARMERMLVQLKQMAVELQRWKIAHGDLQHENIIVGDDDHLRLIDYDGMFVPALNGMPSNEAGHPDYRHPGRDFDRDPEAVRGLFNATLDRFPLIVIYLQFAALAAHPELWDERPEGSEGLLLHRQDFLDPGRSPTIQRLATFDDMRLAVEDMAEVAAGPIEGVPSLGDFIARTRLLDPRTGTASPSVVARSIQTSPITTGGGSASGPPTEPPPRPVDPSIPVLPPVPSDLASHVGKAVELVGEVERGTVRRKDGEEMMTYLYLRPYGDGSVRLAISSGVARSTDVTARGIRKGTWLDAKGTLDGSERQWTLYVGSLGDVAKTDEPSAVARVKASGYRVPPAVQAKRSSGPTDGPARPAQARPVKRKTPARRKAFTRRPLPPPLRPVIPTVRRVDGAAELSSTDGTSSGRPVARKARARGKQAAPQASADLASLLGLRSQRQEEDR